MPETSPVNQSKRMVKKQQMRDGAHVGRSSGWLPLASQHLVYVIRILDGSGRDNKRLFV